MGVTNILPEFLDACEEGLELYKNNRQFQIEKKKQLRENNRIKFKIKKKLDTEHLNYIKFLLD